MGTTRTEIVPETVSVRIVARKPNSSGQWGDETNIKNVSAKKVAPDPPQSGWSCHAWDSEGFIGEVVLTVNQFINRVDYHDVRIEVGFTGFTPIKILGADAVEMGQNLHKVLSSLSLSWES